MNDQNPELEELLWRSHEGELSPEETIALERQLAEDPEAGTLQHQVDALQRVLASVEEVEVPDGLAERVTWLLRRKDPSADDSSQKVRPARRGVAGGQGRWFVPLAAAALVGAIGLVVTVARSPSGLEDDALVAGSLVPESAVADREPTAEEGSSLGFPVGAGGSLEVTRSGATVRVELDWSAGESLAVLEVEGAGILAAAAQGPPSEIRGAVEEERGLVRMSVPAGERRFFVVDTSRAQATITVRVSEAGQVAFERALAVEDIGPGSG